MSFYDAPLRDNAEGGFSFLGDPGTLSFFGEHTRRSVTRTEGGIEGFGYRSLRTTYDNGYSISQTENGKYGYGYSKVKTTYYINNKCCGESESFAQGAGTLYQGYQQWKTFYYVDGLSYGNSVSNASDWGRAGYTSWNTTYYSPDGTVYGTSISQVSDRGTQDIGYNEWITTYNISEKITKDALLKLSEQAREKHERDEKKLAAPVWDPNKAALEARIKVGLAWEAIHEKQRKQEIAKSILIAKDAPKIKKLSEYYLSKEGSKAAWKTIFGEGHTLNEILSILKERALKNPGGASDLTINHFALFSRAPNYEKNRSEKFIEKSCRIGELKKYYLSHAFRFFNASNKIFDMNSKDADLEAVEYMLKLRAKSNPGGASDLTVKHFNI